MRWSFGRKGSPSAGPGPSGIAAVTAPSTSATTCGPSTRARPLSSARRSSVSSSCSRASRSVTDSSGKRGTGSCSRRRYACRSFRSRLDRLSRSTASLKAGCIRASPHAGNRDVAEFPPCDRHIDRQLLAPLLEGRLRQYDMPSVSTSGSPTHLRRRNYRSTATSDGYSGCVVYNPLVDDVDRSGIEPRGSWPTERAYGWCPAGDLA
jgi:hypothetical protein